MSNETSASGGTETPKEPLDQNEMPFYGITAKGRFVVLPRAAYPHRAVERYREQPEFEELELTLYPSQLEVIRESVKTHLARTDDGRPSYLVIRVSDLQIVYASPQVASAEQAQNLLEPENPDYRVGPFSLAEVDDTWLPTA